MRLFVALSISPEVRESLASLISEFRREDSGPRWVNPVSLHITLKFIGSVPEQKLACIDQALTGVAKPAPIRLEFRGIGFFPSERRPSVAWVGIVAPAELTALAASVDASLGACGIACEARSFRPHLTVARFKETHLSEALRIQAEAKKTQLFGEYTVRTFHLMQSQLKPTGAKYTTLRSYSLDPQGIAS